jgi:hypothetical protein
MRRILIRSALLACVVILTSSLMPSLSRSATVTGTDRDGKIGSEQLLCMPSCRTLTNVTKPASRSTSRPIKLAANQAACQYNYNQCMSGCGGMTSCSNQCAVNYQGCMRQ